MLGIKSDETALSNLNREQFDLCFNELVKDNSLFISGKGGIVLSGRMHISKWLIHNKEAPTESVLAVYYGAKPCISTLLTFSDIDEFNYIRGIFEELGICKLKEKHLKFKKKKREQK